MARSKRGSDRGEREGMVCPTLPCAECTRSCLLIHGQRNDPSPIVDSFFKVMLGLDFSNLLYLPPQFVPMVSELIGRETELEDASGNRWKVRLSKHDGVVAFRQGWHDFLLEHGIEAGDFVTFHYVKQSHFIVEIYGHNGCRKLNSSEEQDNRKKRKRTCRNFSASGQCYGTHSDLMNRHGSNMSNASGSNVDISERLPLDIDNASNINNGCGKAQSVPSMNFNEEPFYMIDRDVGERERDRWNCLYDLASFEMQKTPAVDEKSKDEADIVNKIPVAKEAVSSIPVTDVRQLVITEKSKDFQKMDTLKLISEKYSGAGNCSGLDQRNKAYSKNTPLRNTRQRIRRKIADGSELHSLPISAKTQNFHAGQRKGVIKHKRLVNMEGGFDCRSMMHGKYPVMKACEKSLNPARKDGSHVHEVMKTEPVDTSDLQMGPVETSVLPSRVEVKISISGVRGKRSFLELPKPLPLVSSRAKLKADRRLVILLLDPQSRQWPMLYQSKFGMSVLTGGWEAFCEANRIRPGDKCVLVEENEYDHIYKVSIVQNQE
ncbi:uncharacterized protein LOC127789554 isoform X2 [Diospyros lotus]|uniref:uncharacterized protein LOC127789554 isoform X2 n=1 Tax=Diospyros lotus TaxID=55363 RepID=UPI00225427A5|nr:uncharacterized protein LOC127789554 isoform X2 [Diospyros lotus]